MARELRVTVAVMVVVLIAASPAIFAKPSAAPSNYNYLAAVFHVVPTPSPTPIPTPTPPDISTLVIQLHEMKSGYVQDEFEAVTNAEAAKTYADPKAAAAAFIAQGRETSWVSAYSSTDYAFSDALVVSDQVFRYLTPAGAEAGQAATIAESFHDHPDFKAFNISTPCCPTIGLRRTFKAGSLTVDHFLISVRVGRYVTEVESIGVSGYFTTSRAIYYAQLSLNHLTPVPQTMQAGDLPLPAGEPQIDTIDVAIRPH